MIAPPRLALPLLLLVAAIVQMRYVAKAVLPAQDAVDYVSVAQRITREGLAAALRHEPVQPLFPACVAAAHAALTKVGLIAPTDWATAVQVAAAVPLVLAVVPVFFTTRRFAGAASAVAAALSFIFLPEFARLGADGLADSWHLLFVAWAVWAIVETRHVRRGTRNVRSATANEARLLWWIGGTCVGVALLARAEAAVVPLAIGGAWCVARVPTATDGRGFLTSGDVVAFAGGLLVCLIPYVAAGVTGPNELVARLRGGAAPTEDRPLNDVGRSTLAESSVAATPTLADGRPMVFGHKDRTRSIRFVGLSATAVEFTRELLQATGWVVGLTVIAGFAVRRRRAEAPLDRLLLLIVGLHLAITFVMAWRGGYVSGRHFAVPVVALLPAAGAGVVALGGALGAALQKRVASDAADLATAALLTVFVVASLVATVRPVHESQRSHRLAADWLASSAARPGAVLDQQGYSALYDGRTTYRFDAAERALVDPRLAYVVVERGDLEAESRRGQSLRAVLGDADSAEKTFPADRNRRERDVLVFRNPGLALAQGRTNHAR